MTSLDKIKIDPSVITKGNFEKRIKEQIEKKSDTLIDILESTSKEAEK